MVGSSTFVDMAGVGVGRYGSSLAAHLLAHDLERRIFGKPMGSWKRDIPPPKSHPQASRLSDPWAEFELKTFSAVRALAHHEEFIPLSLSRFPSLDRAALP